MKIKSLAKRADGTFVELDGTTYHFKGEFDHVCDVADEAHIKQLLAVPEGFVEHIVQESVASNVIVISGTPIDLAPMTKREIVDLAAEQGIELDMVSTKPVLIEKFTQVMSELT